MLSRCSGSLWVYGFDTSWPRSELLLMNWKHRGPPDQSVPPASSVLFVGERVTLQHLCEAIAKCKQAKSYFKSIKCTGLKGLLRTRAIWKPLLSSENFQSLFTQQVCNPAKEQTVIWSGFLKTCGSDRFDRAVCLWWLCHGQRSSSEYTMRFWHILA